MTFRPELATMVLAGTKTCTRRRTSPNSRSPWFEHACGLKVGRDYAVCPGRGQHAIGRVVVVEVGKVRLGAVSEPESWAEGFIDRAAFIEGWRAINGDWNPSERVWRVQFRVARDG